MDHSDHDDGGKDGSFGSRVVPHFGILGYGKQAGYGKQEERTNWPWRLTPHKQSARFDCTSNGPHQSPHRHQ